MISEPLVFSPLYKDRVWGGRTLATLYNRQLPDTDTPFGESWELVDREDEQSFVRTGALAGTSIETLWRDQRESIFGKRAQASKEPRFPILVKILDARDRLSIQVHPPAAVAPALKGEPKTEMWYIAHADAGAKLYVGLREGVDRESFEKGIAEGLTADQVHAIEPRQGEFIFIPSGRLHAIGAGLVIYEIQQNSDTTYRVFDWNRLGLDGKPRALHVSESLQCIDFDDIEPGMTPAQGETLVDCDYFHVKEWELAGSEVRPAAPESEFAFVAVVSGQVRSGGFTFKSGDFFLVPAAGAEAVRHLTAGPEGCRILVTTLP